MHRKEACRANQIAGRPRRALRTRKISIACSADGEQKGRETHEHTHTQTHTHLLRALAATMPSSSSSSPSSSPSPDPNTPEDAFAMPSQTPKSWASSSSTREEAKKQTSNQRRVSVHATARITKFVSASKYQCTHVDCCCKLYPTMITSLRLASTLIPAIGRGKYLKKEPQGVSTDLPGSQPQVGTAEFP